MKTSIPTKSNTYFILLMVLMLISLPLQAQVGINGSGTSPEVSAGLDIDYNNKGFLIPRVALTSSTDASTITLPATSLLVYNTATVSDVTPGFYFNSGTKSVPKWKKLLVDGELSEGWLLTGNAGTVDGTNFIGTTDNVPLNFRVNNQKSGRIENSANGSTFLGYQAGNSQTATDRYNVAVGYQSLFSNTTGDANTANGYQALYNNTTGYNNTANGTYALNFNTTGNFNTANGYQALRNNTTGSYNTANGYQALYSNTSGYWNIATGQQALFKNTIGEVNIASGLQSLNNNTEGSYNNAYGYRGLFYNTIGNYNIAIGYSPLLSNISGNYNAAYGYNALYRNTTGNFNIANGYQTLFYNTTGEFNTANGYLALSRNTIGSNNTAIGYTADVSLGNLTNATAIGAYAYVSQSNSMVLGSIAGTNGASQSVNVGIGTIAPAERLHVEGKIRMVDGNQGAGKVLTSDANGTATWQNAATGNNWILTGNTGTVDGTNFIGTNDNVPLNFRVNNQKAGRIENSVNGSTFLGYQAGNSQTTTDRNNVGVGYRALYSNTTGYNNTANGVNALSNNTTGLSNTATGYQALWNNTIGSANVATGTSALRNNSTGGFNTANGVNALQGNTTGSYNTAIGYQADVSTGNLSNATAIGFNAKVDASNKVRIGNTSVTSIGGQVGFTNFSDERIKDNIQQDVQGLSFIMKLKPVTYHFNIRRENEIMGIVDTTDWEGKYDIEKIRFSGFIAQDVEKAAKAAGYDFSGVDKSGSIMGLRYAEFTVPLVKAVQEQQDIIEQQNTKINQQEVQISSLKERLERLEQMLMNK